MAAALTLNRFLCYIISLARSIVQEICHLNPQIADFLIISAPVRARVPACVRVLVRECVVV